MKCTQKKCYGDLYCINTRQLLNNVEQGMKMQNTIRYSSQSRVRRYCCVNCGARYLSVEVLNPVSYSKRELPKYRKKNLFETNDGEET